MRVNLGCGQAYLEGWLNVDGSNDVKADAHADAFGFILAQGPEITELYMGHFLEHLVPGQADALLSLVAERLPPGAEVSAVTPDMRAVFAAYSAGEISNKELNESYVYSYVQPSHHTWCHDVDSLQSAFRNAGLTDVEPIDPLTWPPVFHKVGPESRWQCGVRATVPAIRPGWRATAETGGDAWREQSDVHREEAPVSAVDRLLARIECLRRELRTASARAREQQETAARANAVHAELQVARRDLAELKRSRAYAMAERIRRLRRALLPLGSRRQRILGLSGATVNEARSAAIRLKEHWEGGRGTTEVRPLTYSQWCDEHDASPHDLAVQRDVVARIREPLCFRFVVLGGSGDEIGRTLDSFVRQSWSNWQATVLSTAGPLSPHTDTRVSWRSMRGVGQEATLEELNAVVSPDLARDPRQVARESAKAFVVCVNGGDVLAADCLYEVATVATRDPLVDLVYWDDDLVDPAGARREPRFRPAWSPDTLLGANFVGWSFAIRLSRFLAVGGVRPLGEAALWDLLLRSDLSDARVARLPRVLAHVVGRREEITPEGVQAVSEQLVGRNWPARAEAAGDCVRLRWELDRWPRVSVIIPTRHNRALVRRCLFSIAASDYPSVEVVVVDNGERTADNVAWYESEFPHLALQVEWWTEPFNYSAVNNRGAGLATGEVLVFLNDDTEVLDPQWLRELVGWVQQPGVGMAGLQLLDPEGRIQFAGTIVGLGGFADHVFQGMDPGAPSLFGPTGWYRNVLAVTGACLAVRRDAFESVGGFDERFVLCGSDVALGLDLRLAGYRTVCSPFAALRHAESATRGTTIPSEDFFTSYWRYQSWLFGGDPYFSPNLSLTSRVPAVRGRSDKTIGDLISIPLERSFQVFRQQSDSVEASSYARQCRVTDRDVRATRALHQANSEPFEPETVNWFIPELDSPFYGGINTAFRIADHLARNHGVVNRFVVWGRGPEQFVRSAIGAAFPALADSPIVFHDGTVGASLEGIPPADISVATLWLTAYQLTHFSETRRKFYLIQDFEPVFYPAGTMYALAEETYRLGLYGLCNTNVLEAIYENEYGGKGHHFVPAVDQSIFHAEDRVEWTPDRPVTVFVYARAGHWRNCWELAGVALTELKERLGDRVRIVAAGSWATPDGRDLDTVVSHLGLLDYRATGPLYRTCDVGLALTVSKHPSYLPLELMACGVPVVAFDSPHFSWLLRDEENSLLVERTVDGVVDALERLVVDPGLRGRLAQQGLADISANHSSWDKALAGVYRFLCDPENIG